MSGIDWRALDLGHADFRRSYARIAEAVIAAADLPPDVDHTDRAGALTRGLVDRYMEIDQLAMMDVFYAITGYLAQRTGKTPRQIHEEAFASAPSDGWWRGKINDRREEREP